MSRHSSVIDPERLQELVSDLVRRVSVDFPEWADRGSSDPGVTLVELFGFLTESLLYRTGALTEPTRAAMAAAVDRISRQLPGRDGVAVTVDGALWTQVPCLSEAGPDDPAYTVRTDDAGTTTLQFGDGEHGRRPPAGSRVGVSYRSGAGPSVSVDTRWPPGTPTQIELRLDAQGVRIRPHGTGAPSSIRRVRYAAGLLLGAADFSEEQDYFRGRHKRHNRYLHGSGIVEGLSVNLTDGMLRVDPGYALDPEGNEILVPDPQVLRPHCGLEEAFLLVTYAERDASLTPVMTPDQVEASRIEETFRLHLEADVSAGGVPLARVVRAQGGWELDGSFCPPRVKPGSP